MATDNEFVEKGATEKQAEKQTKTGANKGSKKDGTFQLLRDRFNQKKVKSTIGTVLLVLSVYTFLANFSYLLTWEQDQNRVLSKGLFEFLFDGVDRDSQRLFDVDRQEPLLTTSIQLMYLIQ